MKNIIIYSNLSLLHPVGLFVDDVKIKRFKNSFDKNLIALVTLEEHVSTRTKWGQPEEKSKQLFRYHDKNKDEVSLEEFYHQSKWYNINL